jgi:hypothetical protein
MCRYGIIERWQIQRHAAAVDFALLVLQID